MKNFWNDLPKWQKIVASILFFIGLGFGVNKTFVMAGDFNQFVAQQDTKWLMIDRKDFMDRVWAYDAEYGWPTIEENGDVICSGRMSGLVCIEYLRLRDQLDLINDELAARRKERAKK